MALADVGPATIPYTAKVADLLDDENDGVRFWALRALDNRLCHSGCHSDYAIRIAILTSSANKGVRRQARRILKQCYDEAELRVLVALSGLRSSEECLCQSMRSLLSPGRPSMVHR